MSLNDMIGRTQTYTPEKSDGIPVVNRGGHVDLGLDVASRMATHSQQIEPKPAPLLSQDAAALAALMTR